LATVRVDDPAVAVIVTDVASTLCQFKVTLWPGLIALVLAENISVGAPDLPPDNPVQAHKPPIKSDVAEQPIQRISFLLIVFFERGKALYPKYARWSDAPPVEAVGCFYPVDRMFWEPGIKGKVEEGEKSSAGANQ
jgi:hypothetical protein